MPYPPYQIRFVAKDNVTPGPNEPPNPDPGGELTEPWKIDPLDPAVGGIRGSHRVKADVPGGRVTLNFTHFAEAAPTKPNLIVEVSHEAIGGGAPLKKKAAAKRVKKVAKAAKKARPAKAAKASRKPARKAGGRKKAGKRR
jgi:hypothetical protein